MQQRVLLGAGVAVVAIAAFLFFRAGVDHVTTQAVDKNIDRIVATLPPGYAASHGATDTNALTGTVTLHDFKLSYAGKLLWSADTLSVSGGDEHALSDIFDPGAYPNGHPAWTQRRLLVGDATASGVHIAPQDGSGETAVIKSITLHQLSGRPFMLPPTHDHLREPAMQADIALAFAFESLDQHDFVASDTPPKMSRAKIADVSLRNYDGGKIGTAALHRLSIDIDNGQPGRQIVHATLDDASIRKVDFTSALQRARETASADKYALGTTSYDTASLAGLNIDVSPGPRLTIHDISATFPFSDPSGARIGNGTISGLTLALKDSKISDTARAAIDAFGMDSLTMDIAIKARSNDADRHTDFTEDLNLKSLGTLQLAGDITGYDAIAAKNDSKAALLATTLNHASIVFQDAGLVDRSFNAVAAIMHSTPDAVRAQLAIGLVTIGLMIPDQPDAADQIGRFLSRPGTLTVTMNPPEKTTLGDIAQAPAQEKAHLLGLHIQAK